MAESETHKRMKMTVRHELESERYVVVAELLFPPGVRLGWRAYRPDLIGYRREDGREEVVLVECETHPDMRRLASKNHSSVWFQPSLDQRGRIRRILAVPQGKLSAVDMKVRSQWEVWVLGSEHPIEKAPAFDMEQNAPTGAFPVLENPHK